MIGTKILEERESKYNGHLRVVKSIGLGTYIQAEGLTQSGGIVETIWKSTLKRIHKSLATNHKTLILGLGGGTVAKLIRKIWPDAKITGVDIDPVMVELGKKYLGLNEYNISVVIKDAYDFLKTYNSSSPSLRAEGLQPTAYDLILVDLYVGDEFPEKFESENYIRLVRTVLASDGIVVFNRLYYGEKRKEAMKFGKILEKIFEKVDIVFPEANVMFICYK